MFHGFMILWAYKSGFSDFGITFVRLSYVNKATRKAAHNVGEGVSVQDINERIQIVATWDLYSRWDERKYFIHFPGQIIEFGHLMLL